MATSAFAPASTVEVATSADGYEGLWGSPIKRFKNYIVIHFIEISLGPHS